MVTRLPLSSNTTTQHFSQPLMFRDTKSQSIFASSDTEFCTAVKSFDLRPFNVFAWSIDVWVVFLKVQGCPCLPGSSKNPCGFRQMKVVWTFKAFKLK